MSVSEPAVSMRMNGHEIKVPRPGSLMRESIQASWVQQLGCMGFGDEGSGITGEGFGIRVESQEVRFEVAGSLVFCCESSRCAFGQHSQLKTQPPTPLSV